MPTLQHLKFEDLTKAQLRAIVSLINEVWPKPEKSLDQRVEEFTKQRGEGVPREFLAVRDDDKAIAHAEIFSMENTDFRERFGNPRCRTTPPYEPTLSAIGKVKKSKGTAEAVPRAR
ncbi:MAG: hypothetical protein J4G05_10480 [Chlorobi bacterium]|nr:hypothetical protein [Chlorobiota bacterium]